MGFWIKSIANLIIKNIRGRCLIGIQTSLNCSLVCLVIDKRSIKLGKSLSCKCLDYQRYLKWISKCIDSTISLNQRSSRRRTELIVKINQHCWFNWFSKFIRDHLSQSNANLSRISKWKSLSLFLSKQLVNQNLSHLN